MLYLLLKVIGDRILFSFFPTLSTIPEVTERQRRTEGGVLTERGWEGVRYRGCEQHKKYVTKDTTISE